MPLPIVEVKQEREQEIREEIQKWAPRKAPQFSPHMLMCIDLLTLLDRARDANARMMADVIAKDPEYQKQAKAEAAR